MNTKKLIFFVLLFSAYSLSFSQSKQQLDNLEAFNRLYGYTRYFHPSDEASTINWDKFAVYGCERVLSARNSDELVSVLKQLFQPIAPTIKIFRSHENVRFDVHAITPQNLDGFTAVSWQHLGLGMDDGKNVYKSTRLSRSRKANTQKSDRKFGGITDVLNVIDYRGKAFRFTGDVRWIAGPGSGHLLLRVDRAAGQTGFFDNMYKRPITVSSWRKYQISGVLDEDASTVFFGCFLKGDGRLLFDNFAIEVNVDGEWKTIYQRSFEDNLLPSRVSGGLSAVITNRQSSDGTHSIDLMSADFGGPIFDPELPIGEHVKKQLTGQIYAIVPLVLYGNEEFTFPRTDSLAISTLRKRIDGVKDFAAGDVCSRVGNVVITWNIFQHFFPYFDEAQVDWNKAFTVTVKEAFNPKIEFIQTLRKMTAGLKDGHIRVLDVNAGPDVYYRPRFNWEWIEGKLVITSVFDDSASLTVGDIVEKINGMRVNEYFESKIYPFISAGTATWLSYRSSSDALTGPKNSLIQVSVLNEHGERKSISFPRTLMAGEHYGLAWKYKSTQMLTEDTYYINLMTSPWSEIEMLLPKLSVSKNIIFDLRGYPNDNDKILKYLLIENDTCQQWMKIPKILYPDHERIAGYKALGWNIKAELPHLGANVYFITNGKAISYAESFLSFVKHYQLGTIVGEPTAGANGNVNEFTLPGGFKFNFTGMIVKKQDGGRQHGIGVLPDIYVERTITGVRQGSDELLERVLQLIRNN